MDSARTHRRLGLYPPLTPRQSGFLDVGQGHSLYYEDCGRPDGVPVITLHGGPGGGAAPAMRRFFDPRRYRIIVFDQRGCGRSRPYSSLEHNTTAHLVNDIEQLRLHLGVGKWLAFGGSWGATLALAYARACPDRVLGLVLRGVFTCTTHELNWFYRDGANRLFPDAWSRLTDRLSPQEREDVIGAYYKRLTSGASLDERREDALAWSSWESALISMSTVPEHVNPDPHRSDALARIEAHYFHHGGFFEREGVLLEDTKHLKDIPGVIVQGRYDVVCPARSAWDLQRAWPESELIVVEDAGHSAFEPGIRSALLDTTDRFCGK